MVGLSDAVEVVAVIGLVEVVVVVEVWGHVCVRGGAGRGDG